MKTMGLIISHKNGEQRRAILPEDAAALKYPGQLYFESGYGISVGASDEDRIIYREDLKKFKPGTLIIDVSCDPELEIETSRPTTIEDPVYTVDGVIHYAVDNTPAMYPYTVSKILSKGFAPYVDALVTEEYPENIKKAMVIEKGHILDPNIVDFRTARGLFCK